MSFPAWESPPEAVTETQNSRSFANEKRACPRDTFETQQITVMGSSAEEYRRSASYPIFEYIDYTITGENHYHDLIRDLINVILFCRVILYCRM